MKTTAGRMMAEFVSERRGLPSVLGRGNMFKAPVAERSIAH